MHLRGVLDRESHLLVLLPHACRHALLCLQFPLPAQSETPCDGVHNMMLQTHFCELKFTFALDEDRFFIGDKESHLEWRSVGLDSLLERKYHRHGFRVILEEFHEEHP